MLFLVKHLLSILLLLFLVFELNAQISYGGKPLYNPEKLDNSFTDDYVEMPGLPQKVSGFSASAPIPQKGEPLQFAHSYDVNLTPENSGEWSVDESGIMIWRLKIRSEGAYSLNIIFDKFVMTPNASLFIFNPDQSMVLGAFTNRNNKPEGVFAVSPIQGDEIIVELQLKEPLSQKPELKIGTVNHDFLDIFSSPSLRPGNFGDSKGDCHEDVTCDSQWDLQRRSVCRIIVSNQFCSGALVNNTSNDGTPYFLTAAHCIIRESDALRTVFLFNYEVPNCDGAIEGYKSQTISGSVLRAYDKEMDIALLEMQDLIPAIYRPYWAGWKITSTPVAPVTSIHHPQGDVKKIAQSTDENPRIATFSTPEITFLEKSHWRVARWQNGSTEGGSSGSPLFDKNGYIIGSLSGGTASCGNPVDDYYARFDKGWNHYEDSAKQFAYWLDPLNKKIEQLDGLDFYKDKAVRISNFTRDDASCLRNVESGKGTWSGHNSIQTTNLAEEFRQIESAEIHGVYLMIAKSKSSSNQYIDINIRTGESFPDELIASKNNVALKGLGANKENLVLFDTPVKVNGAVWIEVVLKYNEAVDTFAVFQSTPLPGRRNTAWLKNGYNKGWTTFDKQAENFASSLWIDILAMDATLIELPHIPEMKRFSSYPNPVSGILNLEFYTDGMCDVEIFNLFGQKVFSYQTEIIGGKGQVDLSILYPSLYVLKFSSRGEIFSERIIVSGK